MFLNILIFILVPLVICLNMGSEAKFIRRTFHEPNLTQIKVGPNHENPLIYLKKNMLSTKDCIWNAI